MSDNLNRTDDHGESHLPVIEAGGESRRMGCILRTSATTTVIPVLADSFLIPRENWQETDNSWAVKEIKDQNGIGMCNCSASCQALETSRVIDGHPWVKLSGGDLYRRISGGRDQGSMLGDAITELMKNGVCTEADVPYLDWKHQPKDPAAKTRALKYRITEAWDCPSFDHLASAIQKPNSFLVDLGVMWPNADPGKDGWMPTKARGSGGHALCGLGLIRHPTAGIWGIKVANSWTPNWGPLGGFCILPETMFGAFTDGWALRAVVEASDEPVPAPK